MNVKPIRTEADYERALEMLEPIFDAEPGTPDGDTAEVLTILIDKYEEENYPIDYPDPIEAIKIRMENMGMKRKDLGELIGHKQRATDILNRRRRLTLDMIRVLSSELSIPIEVLTQSYPLAYTLPKMELGMVAEDGTEYKPTTTGKSS